MANKKRDSDLFNALLDSGLRKRVARTLSQVDGRGKRGSSTATVSRTIDKLRQAASELESRIGGSSRRSEAAKKAARTRKRKAAKRSASAKQAAKTRAKGK